MSTALSGGYAAPGDLAGLRMALDGEVIGPDTPGYDEARTPALARFRHVRPRAVVRCASPDDVAHTLGFARRSGLSVVARGGGHCFAGRSSTEGIVLDLTPMRSVTVSPPGVATIGAGARLAAVYEALHAHGLTLPAGCGAGVGIAGLTLGGGLGTLGRRYGLTSDRLRAARVVLADGRTVDCDETREPDLFWALRGAGGGQFGVVTSLVFDAVPITEATAFLLAWRFADAAEVLAAWQEWAPHAPDAVSANLRIDAGRVVVFGAVLGPAADLIDEFVGLVCRRPQVATLAVPPHADLKRSLAELVPDEPASGEPASGEPASGEPFVSRSHFFRRSLPPDGIADLLDTLVRVRPAGRNRALHLTPMGGAYNRVPAGATAFVHRAERFLLEHVETGVDASRWVHRSRACVAPWASGRVYPNFPDPDLTDWAEAYHGANLARLIRVKRDYDPDGVFHFPQAIPTDFPQSIPPIAPRRERKETT
jgi:hypothetical protein